MRSSDANNKNGGEQSKNARCSVRLGNDRAEAGIK